MKILLSALLGFISMNAFAVNPTQGPLQQDPSLCRYGYNQSCNQSAPPPPTIVEHVTINVPSKYGALAHDRHTGNVGGALNANSLSEAKKAAIKQCSQSGKNKNCKIVNWVRNGCVAAAGGKQGNKWVLFSAADVPGKTESVAMNRCKADGMESCRIISPEGCSVPDGMYN